MIPNRRAIIPALTGLRAVAAGMIFFYHWFFTHAASLPLAARAPFDVGYVGVAIFFALSGFLLTVRYLDDLEQRRTSYGGFLLKRFTRTYPLYLVVLSCFIIALGRPTNMVPRGVRAVIVSYTLTQALFPSLLHIGTTVGWALTVEWLFYLIAPPLMRWLGQSRTTTAVVWRAVAAGAGAVVLGLIAARLPLAALLPDTLIGAPDTYILHYSIFGHLPDFLAGMACGLIFLRHDAFSLVERYARLLAWGSLAAIYALILALDAVKMELGSPLNRALAFGVALFSSVMILSLSSERMKKGLLSWLLGNRVMAYLGTISYALFLIQLTEPCQWIYWVFLGVRCGVQNQVWRAILLYPIATVIAVILYELVERPSSRWLNI